MNKLDFFYIPKYISYNLISNLLTSILIFISLPIYLQIMDVNDFGFFCFVYVLLIIFKIFDFGFSATSTRYISQVYNSELWQIKSKNLIKICEVLLLFISLIVLVFFLKFNNYVVSFWINFDNLQSVDFDQSNLKIYSLILIIFSAILFFKLLSTLYRGVLYGIGEQPLFNVIRFFFELIILLSCVSIYYFFKSILLLYFNFLFFVFIETILYKLIINKKLYFFHSTSFLNGFKILYNNKYFALNIAFTSFLWLVTSNLDKVFFVNYISIDIYGAYTIITTLSILPLLLFVPIFEAAFPNLNNLYHSGKIKTFKQTINLLIKICIIFMFVCLITYQLFGEVFWNYLLKDSAKLILANEIFLNFLLGYFLLSFSYIVFTILKIKGILKIHSILTAIWTSCLFISIYIAIIVNKNPEEYSQYWLLINIIYFTSFVFLNLLYFKVYDLVFYFIKQNIISIFLFLALILIIRYLDFGNFYIFYKDFIIFILSTFSLIFIFIITNRDLMMIIKNFLTEK